MFLSSITIVECSHTYDLVLVQGVLAGELENDLAYSSNLDGAWHLSIYTLALSHKKTTRKRQRERDNLRRLEGRLEEK